VPVRAGVVGLGLIGGSLLRALARRNAPAPIGFDLDPAVGEMARTAGFEVSESPQQLAAACDVVLIAVPPAAAVSAALEVLEASGSVVVSDVCSVKAPVVNGVLGAVAPEAATRFVGSHPLTGDERGGFGASRAGLFDGASWALCPGEAGLDAVVDVTALIDSVGARTLVLDPALHDQTVAWSSHLPHVLAALLAAPASGDPQAAGAQSPIAVLSGGALRDATRVAAADPALWLSILRTNADALVSALVQVSAQADELAAGIGVGDLSSLERALAGGLAGRAAIERGRWSEPQWERAEGEFARWREVLLADGRAGRAIRHLTYAGPTLRYERTR
jgi:prephenate dehydrogenase